MNKSSVTKIHARIGFWIRYERRKHIEISNNSEYRQKKFILLNENEVFMDFVPGEAVCSRPTLSRLENGKTVYETSLLDFFLNRFNQKYRISDFDERLIDTTIQAFTVYIFKNNSIATHYLRKVIKDTNIKITNNFLWDEDYKMLIRFIEWFDSFRLIQNSEFDEYYYKFKIYHKKIQDILIVYFVFSVYFNPELWSKYSLISKLLKDEYESNEFLNVFNDLFNHCPNNVYQTFYRNYQSYLESGFLQEIILPLKFLLERKYHLTSRIYRNLMYLNLVNKIITKDYNDCSEFESCMFNFLNNHKNEINLDINHLLYLIKDEPYPRIINNLVLKQIHPKLKTKSHLHKVLTFIFE